MSLVEAHHDLGTELRHLLGELKPRANSLIVTVLGDAILPRGGSIWLGELVQLMSVFGLSDRLVRTAVYRLSQEDWLTSRSEGRRALYSLTTTGHKRFSEAGRRIYAAAPAAGSDHWTLVQGLPNIIQAERQELRRRLKWFGFGQFSTSLMALPGPVPAGLMTELEAGALEHKVLVFSSTLADPSSDQSMRTAAAAAWPLEDLNGEYGAFVGNFESFAANRSKVSGPIENFALRTLLVHEYRRILLKDPHLPAALLPEPWNGSEALALSSRLYKQITSLADQHVDGQLAGSGDNAPALQPEYKQRFGGLS